MWQKRALLHPPTVCFVPRVHAACYVSRMSTAARSHQKEEFQVSQIVLACTGAFRRCAEAFTLALAALALCISHMPRRQRSKWYTQFKVQ